MRDLRKTYDNGTQALKGVSLEVAPGDFFALLGPNGAGKSTLIGIISSLVNLSEGKVEVFGSDLVGSRSATMRLIGLVPQEINFNLFEKPFDILVNYAGFYGVPARRPSSAPKRNSSAHTVGKAQVMSRTLSGGMKRRLMIARAMMTRPRLLILDEPTAGVDIEIRRDMWRVLKEINAAGTTIILTTTTWKKPNTCAATWRSSTTARSSSRGRCAPCWPSWTWKASCWTSTATCRRSCR